MYPFIPYPRLSSVVEELTEAIEVAIRINPLLQLDKSLDLTLRAPVVLRRVVRSLAVVLIDVFLVVAGKRIEELLLLNEPVIDQSVEAGIEVCGLKDSAGLLVRKS